MLVNGNPGAIPHRQLICGVVTFQDGAPPWVPNIICPPELVQWLPYIASSALNAISASAQVNTIRCYAFNAVMMNNTQNNEYAELVKFCTDLIAHRFRTGEVGFMDIQQINNTVQTAVTLWSSYIASHNVALMNELDMGSANAVRDNTNIYYHWLNMFAQSQVPSRQNIPTVGNAGFQRHIPQGNLNQGMIGQGMVGQNMMVSSVSHRPSSPANKFAQGNIAAKPVPQTHAVKPVAGIMGVVPASASHPITHVANPSLAPTATSAEEPKQEEVRFTKDIVIGEQQMDRNLHRIAYHDVFFTSGIDGTAARKETSAALKKAVVEYSMAEKQKPERIRSVSLDAILGMLMAEKAADIEKPIDITMLVVDVDNVIAAADDIVAIFNKLRGSYTFSDMAAIFRNAVTTIVPDTAVQKKKNIAWVAQVDRVMTREVNDWLLLTFPDHGTRIDSFMEDIIHLPAHIKTTFGDAAFRSYQTWQRDFLHNLIYAIGSYEDDATEIIDEATGQPLTDVNKVYKEIIQIAHGVFYVNELAECLNYSISKTPVEVTSKATPILYNLVSSMVKAAEASRVTRNLLVTADGVRYSFARSSVDEAIFYIQEV